MIILFEPQCRGFAHEQFNAGFLYGYSLAYPNEKIVFYAEKEHIKCIQNIFVAANLSLTEVQFIETGIPEFELINTPKVIFEYYKILKKFFDYSHKNYCNKVVLLSIHTYNLLPLKYLLFYRYKNAFQIHIAAHGILESIKRKNILTLNDLLLKVIRRLRKYFNLKNLNIQPKPANKWLFEKLFKTSLQLFGNRNITYCTFREDSLVSLKTYMPGMQKYFKSIDLPYIYKDLLRKNEAKPSNRNVYATIGQGNISAVQEVVRKLNNDTRIDVNNFEIRIIGGGHNIGKDNLEPIKYIGDGQRLSRDEIEEQIKDVKYFLFFYDQDSYELTTSGAFFDAIAYSKPIIFLKNHCFDYYYQNYKFGYRCENINEIVATIQKINTSNDENYLEFISEIRRMQNDTSISNNYYKLNFID